jgi:hypothetical protein
MTQINGFRGFVGYGLRELNENETYFYCSISNKNSLPPLIKSRINFTSDFSLRSYTSGCYYYDTDTGKWSSNGMDIYEDTNLEYAHCVSNHLTSFASGLVLSPSIINFQYSYATFTMTQNSIIYSIVIVFLCLYVFFAIWSRIMDKRDEQKMGIYFLEDNYPNELYFYELIVFTGNRSESETNSKVNFDFIFNSNLQRRPLDCKYDATYRLMASCNMLPPVTICKFINFRMFLFFLITLVLQFFLIQWIYIGSHNHVSSRKLT